MSYIPVVGQGAPGSSPWAVSGSVYQVGGPWAVSGTISIASPLPSGTNLLGDVNVRGYSAELIGTPVLSGNVAYSTGQLLGGLMTLSGAVRVAPGRSILQTVTISDKAKQNAAMTLVFFSKWPTSTTFGDHQALNVNAADLVNAKVLSIAATDWVSFSANSCVTEKALALEFASNDGNLYCCLMSGGTPTYSSTSDLQITLGTLME